MEILKEILLEILLLLEMSQQIVGKQLQEQVVEL